MHLCHACIWHMDNCTCSSTVADDNRKIAQLEGEVERLRYEMKERKANRDYYRAMALERGKLWQDEKARAESAEAENKQYNEIAKAACDDRDYYVARAEVAEAELARHICISCNLPLTTHQDGKCEGGK